MILLVQLGVVAALHGFFVQTAVGQRIDAIPQLGAIGSISILFTWLEWALHLIGPLSLIMCGVPIALLLIMSQWRTALLAALVTAGANLTTQILKRVLGRPFLERELPGRMIGEYPDLQVLPSSLPSGHATAVAAMAVVVIMAVPPRLRFAITLAGAASTALTGLAVIQVGWHRPSDVIAAFLVVGFWLTLGSLLVSRSGEWAPTFPRAAPLGLVLFAVGMIIFVVTGLTADPSVLIQPGWIATIAYAGSAAAIIGSALMLLVLSLTTCARAAGLGLG